MTDDATILNKLILLFNYLFYLLINCFIVYIVLCYNIFSTATYYFLHLHIRNHQIGHPQIESKVTESITQHNG